MLECPSLLLVVIYVFFTLFRSNQTFFINSNTVKTINKCHISELTLIELFILIFRQLFSLLDPCIDGHYRIRIRILYNQWVSINVSQPVLSVLTTVDRKVLGQITKKVFIGISVAVYKNALISVLKPLFSSPQYQILFVSSGFWVNAGGI